MQPLSDNTINVPAFLSKLWKMVNDPSTDHLICWGPNGTSFIIQNQAQFWYELLPVYYKHNNMSSFVRQLNMYGFHKMSTIENGTMDIDKDEIKFFHPYFQRDKPELMRNIKRKVTGSAKTHAIVSENTNQTNFKSDDITRVLSDVKHLKGRQSSVDSQLSAMKQENAVLWRELALLRQKHLKQQQIVNKLIQFLVTIVQPTARMGGLGVKRHYPLMINESPTKKMKTTKPPSTTSEGPIIHELDNADALQDELLAEANSPVQEELSPKEIQKNNITTNENDLDTIWDSPDFVNVMENDIVEELLSDSELPEEPNSLITEDTLNNDDQKVFLNPATQDTLLSNLMNGSYNTNTIKDIRSAGPSVKKEGAGPEPTPSKDDMTVATREATKTLSRLNSVEDLDFHVENTQNELNQLKELLNGCTSLDANTLLGLFNDDSPPYGLTYNNTTNNDDVSKNDPVFGSEVAPYANNLDFSQLFDDSSEEYLQTDLLQPSNLDSQGSINTPNVQNDEPTFPNVK